MVQPDPKAFTFKPKHATAPTLPVYPGNVEHTLHAYLSAHPHTRFTLGRMVDGKREAIGPPRTLADALVHYPDRIVTESKDGDLWRIETAVGFAGWILDIRAVAYTSQMRVDAAARTQLGVPYVFDAIDPKGPDGGPGSGFDCSGLSEWAWATVGTKLPHNAAAQLSVVSTVDVPQTADLVGMHVEGEAVEIGHVGLWVRPGFVIDTRHPITEPVAIREIFSLVAYGRPTPGRNYV